MIEFVMGGLLSIVSVIVGAALGQVGKTKEEKKDG